MFKSKLLNLLVFFQAMLLACLLPIGVEAQQADAPDAETAEATTTDDASTDDVVADDADETTDAAEDSEDSEDIEDADLDEQTYEQDDDDFIPTEEVPADEPIPFPSNI